MAERQERLQRWLSGVLPGYAGELQPASEDASFRRYFRIHSDGLSRIVMDAPPDKEDCHRFVQVAKAFARRGLHVPEVLAADYQQGFLLLSDFGACHYLSVLTEENADALYGDALQSLLALQRGGAQDIVLPPYDRALLMSEMQLFRDWYLERHLGLVLNAAREAVLTDSFTVLAQAALDQPRVWVHRDFHSRNLMVLVSDNPGVLDFQDAVVGPVTYDLVSLLRDCYIAWPEDWVGGWVRRYHAEAQVAGIIRDIPVSQFQRWFDYMGIQRHLKAIGIFARLYHRDGKTAYLQEIPRTMDYLLTACERYPVLHGLQRLLAALP